MNDYACTINNHSNEVSHNRPSYIILATVLLLLKMSIDGFGYKHIVLETL